MLNLNYLPVHFSLFLIIGIILGLEFNFSIEVLLIVMISSLLLLIYLHFKAESSYEPPILFVLITAFLFLNIGILGVKLKIPQNQKKHYTNFIKSENRTVLKISKLLKSNRTQNRYQAKIIELNGQRVSGKVLLTIRKDSVDELLNIDELLYTAKSYLNIQGAKNPYEFDYKEYLKHRQIYHQLTLEPRNFIALGLGKKSFKGAAHSFRTRINRELERYNFSNNELAIVNALLLGQRQDITRKQFIQYRDAGAIHILAVSGLHIGIILLFLNFLFQPIEKLKNGKLIKLIIIISCLWTYALLAGLSASIIRSVTMFTAVAIGMTLNRPMEIRNSLIISLFFLLLINPFYLFDIGFQLSYTAVFSIVWLQPIFRSFWMPKAKLLRYLWNLLLVTFSAQLGILPLTLFYFHQFPGLFFVSSVVIIPFIGVILGLGFLVIFLALMHILPQIMAEFYELILRTMNLFVALISSQEEMILKHIPFSVLLLFSSYILIVSSIIWLKNKSIKKLYSLLISILILQVCLTFEKFKIQSSNEFIVFHQSRNTILGNRIGENLLVYKNDISRYKSAYSPLNAYKNGLPNLTIKRETGTKNMLKVGSKNILIINKSASYKNIPFYPDLILLINSPKINMNRMIEILHPKIVIADGSNYRSYVLQWDKTCKEKSIQFHNTSSEGAYVYHYTP